MDHSFIDQYLMPEEEARWPSFARRRTVAELAAAANIPFLRLRGRIGAERVLFAQHHHLHPRFDDLDAANEPCARREGFVGPVYTFVFTSLHPDVLADAEIERVHRVLTMTPMTRLTESQVAESVGVDKVAVRRYYELYERRLMQRPLAGTDGNSR